MYDKILVPVFVRLAMGSDAQSVVRRPALPVLLVRLPARLPQDPLASRRSGSGA